MKALMAVLGIAIWIAFAAVRLILVVIGWFFVPLTLLGDGSKRTPPLWRPVYGNVEENPAAYATSFWKKYVWMAWRNPTNGLKGLIEQPVPEVVPNPDARIRNENAQTASRWMQSGIFWEYWWMKQIDWTIRGKHYKFFEFRIGWKFVDGNEEFFPTVQLGPRSS